MLNAAAPAITVAFCKTFFFITALVAGFIIDWLVTAFGCTAGVAVSGLWAVSGVVLRVAPGPVGALSGVVCAHMMLLQPIAQARDAASTVARNIRCLSFVMIISIELVGYFVVSKPSAYTKSFNTVLRVVSFFSCIN